MAFNAGRNARKPVAATSREGYRSCVSFDLPIADKKATLSDLYIGAELASIIAGALHQEAAEWQKAQYKLQQIEDGDPSQLPPEVQHNGDDDEIPF